MLAARLAVVVVGAGGGGAAGSGGSGENGSNSNDYSGDAQLGGGDDCCRISGGPTS